MCVCGDDHQYLSVFAFFPGTSNTVLLLYARSAFVTTATGKYVDGVEDLFSAGSVVAPLLTLNCDNSMSGAMSTIYHIDTLMMMCWKGYFQLFDWRPLVEYLNERSGSEQQSMKSFHDCCLICTLPYFPPPDRCGLTNPQPYRSTWCTWRPPRICDSASDKLTVCWCERRKGYDMLFITCNILRTSRGQCASRKEPARKQARGRK